MTQLTSRLSSVRTSSSGLPPHLIIIARAGTGKTTTMIEGLKYMKGLMTKIIPSAQQQAIWDELLKSRGVRFICATAFNRSIATVLKTKVPSGVDAKTVHGLGFSAVNKKFKLKEKDGVDGNLPSLLMVEQCPNWDALSWEERDTYSTTVPKLVGLTKANLMDPTWDNLDQLCSAYDIDTNGRTSAVYDLVTKVIQVSKDPELIAKRRVIDYNDMVWLPVVLNLPVWVYDVLLVDEAQDLNRAQQALIMKAGRRLILCGDPAQAIYGFAGADCKSLPRMEKTLAATPAGVKMLDLNMTYRCGKKIVKEAQRFVKEFQAHESNPEGSVIQLSYKEEDWNNYRQSVRAGDMILCRTNAPLVSACFRFLKEKRKAIIQGREIGAGLIKLIKKLRAKTIEELAERLQAWYDFECKKEESKKFPSEARLITLADRRDCINCFIEESTTVQEVIETIDKMFADTDEPSILCSSIHQAKGLEAPNVFLLTPPEIPFPHPMAKTAEAMEQEYNLRYVGVTRAINRLVYVV